ncbi:MAG: hypothetical protein KAR07_12485 [Spirochaetes bacterium]|nr:hypothetical protein [Spirochaetota bacterium]
MNTKKNKKKSKKRYRSSSQKSFNKHSDSSKSESVNENKRRSTSKHTLTNDSNIKQQKFKEKLQLEKERIQNDLDILDENFKKEVEKIKKHKSECSICRQPIDDMLSAIGSEKNNDTRHFTCAQKEILKYEKLLENEELTYIGGGDFVIIQKQKNKGKKNILLRKRINYKEPASAQKTADG